MMIRMECTTLDLYINQCNLLNILSNFSTFLNIYKWLIWKFTFESRTTCWWHVPVFSNIWQRFSAKNLDNDLNKINNWAFRWKMIFNWDSSKQDQEVLFSCKIKKSSQPSLNFNNKLVAQSITQKHLGMFLDTKLDLHLKSIHG